MLMLYSDQTVSTCLNEQNVLVFHQMFDVVQILSNTVKHDQTMCPNGKMFGHKTMLDRSRLDLAFSLLSVSVECK